MIISVPQWNWYGFPTDFTLANGLGDAVGWGLVGLVAGRIVK